MCTYLDYNIRINPPAIGESTTFFYITFVKKQYSSRNVISILFNKKLIAKMVKSYIMVLEIYHCET